MRAGPTVAGDQTRADAKSPAGRNALGGNGNRAPVRKTPLTERGRAFRNLPVTEAVEETAEDSAFARERGLGRGSDGALTGDGLVVVGPGDGVDDLGLVEV